MKLAKIVRPVWSTRKTEKLEGIRLLEAEILDIQNGQVTNSGEMVIVCDNMGAGIGEVVFVTMGSAVRDVVFSDEAPFKLVSTAIVDQVFIDEQIFAKKARFVINEGKR